MNYFEGCGTDVDIRKVFEDKFHMTVSKHQVELISLVNQDEVKTSKDILIELC